MSEDFNINDVQINFDFKGFLFKLLSYWPLFLISLAIAFGIAYYVNVRKLAVYRMSTLVTIKDDQNPFFTANTSLTFNWGGTTDKVNTAVVTLNSRTHNEKVVERLQYYINYKRDGKYQLVDAYKQTPFFIEADTTKPQLLGQQFKVVFKDSVNFTLTAEILEDGNKTFQIFNGEKEKLRRFVQSGLLEETFQIGTPITTPYFNGTFLPNKELKVRPNKPYYFNFSNFDNAVKGYLSVKVNPANTGSSVLNLSLVGKNKARIVDYLNTSVQVLSDDMLERKNLFATKTIRFIDSSLGVKTKELKDVEKELNDFRDKNNVFDLNSEGVEIKTKLSGLDVRKEGVDRELTYYNTLEDYLRTRNDYTEVPAPSVAGINEASITTGVSQIVQLAQRRSTLEYSYKEGATPLLDIDRQIDAVKNVLLENITSTKGLKNQELRSINSEIGSLEFQIKKLPKEQQDLLKIERQYSLTDRVYNMFLSKKGEADLVKAANVSDVQVIDEAKDTGGGKIGPNTQLNYVMALLFGLIIPFVFVFLRVFFDTKVHHLNEVERNSRIPILGVIGKSRLDSNLAVLSKPKSAIAEAFRALRSGLQFLYRKQGIEGCKTVLVTSSVSGEGKTFTSINIASVFALSQKKTVLVGLDLRKPKIFGDFDINNATGVVNFLVNDATVADIIQPTKVSNLDIITSGPIPPNPSELLMSERMELLVEKLKEEYDYIILDTPPMGLVADSLELLKYADATIYMIRQNYTRKRMLSMINEKYKRGEVKNISFVLNYYQEKAKYGYGYGYGYGSGYGYGYGGYGKYGNGYHEEESSSSYLQRFGKIFRKNK